MAGRPPPKAGRGPDEHRGSCAGWPASPATGRGWTDPVPARGGALVKDSDSPTFRSVIEARAQCRFESGWGPLSPQLDGLRAGASRWRRCRLPR